MSDNTKLIDDDLNKVTGGACGTYDGITYSDNEIFIEKGMNINEFSMFQIFILKNCGADKCDVDTYFYKKYNKSAKLIGNYYKDVSYSSFSISGYEKIDLEILNFE